MQLRTLAGFAIGLTALAIAACNGTIATSSTGGPLPLHAAGMPLTSPTPFNFNYYTVDDPGGSGTFTRVLGIDALGEVAGTYGKGTKVDPSHGFTSLSPYSDFRTLNYPSALDTVATSLNSSGNRITAGYFLDSTSSHTTWAFLRVKGIFSQYKNPQTPHGSNTVNEFLGVNDPGVAVGFYKDSNGHDVAYEFSNAGGYHSFKPTSAVSAVATGINLRGDVTGFETLTDGKVEGWLLHNGAYERYAYPYTDRTEGLAVNYQEHVVGFYNDSSGNTHGFILFKPGSPSQEFWQTIDEPNAAGTTVVTSINNHDSISGWYVDSAGNTHGFVATVQGSPR
jgi:hypothetical protein